MQRLAVGLEQVGAAGDLAHARVAHVRQLLAHLARGEVEEVVHVEGRAHELLAQLLLVRARVRVRVRVRVRARARVRVRVRARARVRVRVRVRAKAKVRARA